MIVNKLLRTATVALLVLAYASSAGAQNYDIDINNFGVHATPIKQANPGFPSQGIRRGQEGWVRVNFVLNEEGRVLDPLVLDSSGGGEFEAAALDAVKTWQFAAPAAPHFNNSADIRFEYFRGSDRATSNFLRRYRRIVTHLHYEQPEDAREEVDAALELGGWNLYESSMLWLMIGRVEGAEDDDAGKLETYRRALAISNRTILDDENRCDLLGKLFELEVQRAQYAAARRTFRQLAKEPAGDAKVAAARDKAAEVDRLISSSEPLSARGTVYNACDCDAGQPLWSYVPARRTFSFSNLDGNVERFEVRCEKERISESIVTDKSWSLPEESGSCRVFVFGDDGASFNFVEHSDNESVEQADDTAVARIDVLDR